MSGAAYALHRTLLYTFLWTASVVQLGLTGWRVHHTESTIGDYDPIIVELLVTAALTILWIPVAIVAPVRKSKDLLPGSGYGTLGIETCGNFVLWVMWLVGGAIATNKWPTRAIAGSGKDGHILITIVAFSWLCFGALTIVKFLTGLHYATLKGGEDAAHSPIQEKRPGTA
ncbi:hypothetical protein ACEPAF_9318 [Sanghuangporus sanghuang]|uniref:MARVEL domain-containing protein n=1 Tax=Sanghuangporus baumii TaxID=108892 RepID=A0A9Q5I403_SANBA|nr:hypothetical protein A7U60_g1500 [Sanghuangporus baumii]